MYLPIGSRLATVTPHCSPPTCFLPCVNASLVMVCSLLPHAIKDLKTNAHNKRCTDRVLASVVAWPCSSSTTLHMFDLTPSFELSITSGCEVMAEILAASERRKSYAVEGAFPL